MTKIKIQASRSYEVLIGSALLAQAGELLSALCPQARRTMVVTDSNVAPLYGQAVVQAMETAGFQADLFSFPAGEKSKTGATYLQLLETLAESQMTRSDVLVALGGGVVGDLAGFAAATYLRGIAYIQLPTTLLAMVDSSVGGKTAIDLHAGKNLAGAFYQPHLVLCDTDTLETLPEENFSDGCAEVIKYGMLGSEALLKTLHRKSLRQGVEEVIAQCVTMKRDMIGEDEFDHGQRQLLNLGHTVGHAIEACSGYTISHGTAVAIGMAVITRAAVRQGLCPFECLDRLGMLLRAFDLPNQAQFTAQQLNQAALGDKKRQGDTISIVIPRALGRSELRHIPVEQLLHWIELGLRP